MIVVLLVAIVVVVCISGFVKRRSSAPLGGVFLDVSGAHHDTVVGSLQQYRPHGHRPHAGAQGFDMQHWTSVHWG